MSTVEKELWETFTYYTTHGNALDPFHISYNTFNRLCSDCGLYEDGAFPGCLMEADVFVIFTREARTVEGKKRTQMSSGSGQPPSIPYGVFLTCLLRVAEKLYPVEQSFKPEQAMQKLLMEHLFVLAKKRDPDSVQEVLQRPGVRQLYKHFKEALKQLFDFYSQQSIYAIQKAANGASRGKTAATEDRFMGTLDLSRSGAGQGGAGGPSSSSGGAPRTMEYTEYLQFAHDVGCGKSISLSIIELGDAYLTAITPKSSIGMLDVKRLTFPQLWECIVRWALLTHREHPMALPEEKIKSLFLDMWHHLQDSIPHIMGSEFASPQSAGNSSKAVFIRGCQMLNERFQVMWAEDGHRIYLGPQVAERKDAAKVLGSAISQIRALGEQHVELVSMLGRPTSEDGSHEKLIIEVEGSATDLLGDPRITVGQLNRLLAKRPDVGRYLQRQLILPAA